MKKTVIFTMLLCCIAVFPAVSYAAAPAGYYKSLDGKKDAQLKNAVHEIIYKFTQISSYQDLPRYFERTDVYPDSKRWWDMYSDIPLYAPSFSGLNREHSFPKSWWGGLTDVPAYVDLNHLYPSEMRANTAKNNYPLGTVDRSATIKFQNGITTVGYPVNGQGGGCSYVFEPADQYKGDFARTYFYMVTCYQDLTWKYMYMLQQNTYPTLNPWSVDLLLKWHKQDPVSQKELDRNEVVYSIQNNRNPFIDHPELADYIWGDKKGQPFKPGDSGTTPSGDPELITPVQDMYLDFGQVAKGNYGVAKLLFKGKDIDGSVKIRIRPNVGNPDMFTLESTTLSGQLVNADAGYELNITYKPTELGSHTARVLITVDGIDGSRGVELRGECVPVPVLDPCTATDATDITSSSYVANWTYPESNVVDYWVITRTRFIGSQAVSEKIIAETPGHLVEGFDQSDRETYSVQSSRLGYLSPMSNIITVAHAGITGVEAEHPFAVIALEGAVRFVTDGTHTGVKFYDVSGRIIRIFDCVDCYDQVYIPSGFYLVTTDQHPAPVKVSVK